MENKKEEPALNKVTFVNGVQIKNKSGRHWRGIILPIIVKLIKTETVISVLMGHFIRKLLFILLFVKVLIAPANAQNKRNMYSYKKIGNKYIIGINNRAEIVKALDAFCKEEGILSGSINRIGAIGELALRFFNPETKAYGDKTFRKQVGISNLTRNVSSTNKQVYLHLHITVGRSDYSALAGHLLSVVQDGAGEFVVEDYSERISHTYNPDLGLNIYDFER